MIDNLRRSTNMQGQKTLIHKALHIIRAQKGQGEEGCRKRSIRTQR
jgi:hypothetical protein